MADSRPLEEILAEIQTTAGCTHMEKAGIPCDVNSGGLWSCGCAIMAFNQKHHKKGEVKFWKVPKEPSSSG